MNTTNKSIYDTTPYLNRRIELLRYEYRPEKYAFEKADWEDGKLTEFQQVGEFVIATITTESILTSVTTIFGKKVKKGIRYRIVDEQNYVYSTMTAQVPLSLGELVDFIDDSGGLGIYFTVSNYCTLQEEMHEPTYEKIEELVEEYRNFTSIDSPYYEQLGIHYDYLCDEWADNMLAEWDGPTPIE